MRAVTKGEGGPLEWLRQRRDKSGRPMISDEEFRAGERLRADFEKAQLQPRVTASWSALPGNGGRRSAPGMGLELRDAVIAAQDRVRRALTAVGTDHANILLDVCCLETGLSDVERTSGWPQRSGKIVLQIALRQLARHYGFLKSDDTGAAGRGRIMQWGQEGYRGTLEKWTGSEGDGA